MVIEKEKPTCAKESKETISQTGQAIQQILTFFVSFRKFAELVSGNVRRQVVADVLPLRLEVARARRLGLAPRPELAARVVLARLLAGVPGRLRVLVAEAVVVAEVGGVVLEAAAVVAVSSFRTLERLDMGCVCFSLIWKCKVMLWCKINQ